jgi:hypothetical protein
VGASDVSHLETVPYNRTFGAPNNGQMLGHHLILSSHRPIVLLSSSHCAALSLSHLTGWLLHHLLLHRPLIVLSLRRSLVFLCQLVVASPPVAPTSCPLVVPPSCPLVVLSLHCPLVISLRRLVVALLLVAPPSRCPLTAPPSCHLAPAGCCCCVAS